MQTQDQVVIEGAQLSKEECDVRVVSGESTSLRKQMLAEILSSKDCILPPEEKECLHSMLLQHHSAFSLEEDERGETDLTRFVIDTGDSPLKKQPVRRTPFAVRQEIAQQLKTMQRFDVIQPSNSPWASPVVLVRKKGGSLRFCIDYRANNSVTKSDTYLLPRIDDILD